MTEKPEFPNNGFISVESKEQEMLILTDIIHDNNLLDNTLFKKCLTTIFNKDENYVFKSWHVGVDKNNYDFFRDVHNNHPFLQPFYVEDFCGNNIMTSSTMRYGKTNKLHEF